MIAEGCIWVVVGAYFVLIGCGRLPLPRGGIGDWFDAVSRERFRLALQPFGVGFIGIGLTMCFRLL